MHASDRTEETGICPDGSLQRFRSARFWGVLMIVTSCLLLIASQGMPLPRYNMAMGDFSMAPSLNSETALGPSLARTGVIFAATGFVILAVVCLVLQIGRALGARFAVFLLAVAAVSWASLIPLSGPNPPLNFGKLFAMRALALSLMVIASGWILGRLVPPGFRLRPPRFLGSLAAPPWPLLLTCVGTALVVLAIRIVQLDGIPHAMDEIIQIFQAKIFATGRLWADPPPLPELISHFGVITDGGKWRGMHPPGHALMMTPFVGTGLLLLYPSVVSSLTVLAVFYFVSRADDRSTAWLAVLLLLSSPWFWSMGSSYMSHVPSALLLSGFLACFVRAREGSVVASLFSGLFLGAAAATREADALFITLPFGVLWLADFFDKKKIRRWFLRSGAMAAGLLPGLGFLLVTNLIVNGGPFVFGHDLLFEGPYRFGLGPKPPGIQIDPLTPPIHTLSDGLLNFAGLLTELQLVLFGLGIPAITLVALSALARFRDKLGLVGLAALALYLAAYIFFPLDMKLFGPRYAYGALPLFVWLGARAIRGIHRWLGPLGKARLVPGALAVGIAVALFLTIPRALGSFDPNFAGVDSRLDRALEEKGIDRAVVIVLSDSTDLGGGTSFLYTAAFSLADPELRGIVPVHLSGGASVERVLEAFPDRRVFAWLALYEGDFRRARFLASMLVEIRRPGDHGYETDREIPLRRALGVYYESLRAGPRSSAVWNTFAVVAWLSGDAETARKHLVEASSRDPADPNPWLNRALIEHSEGRPEKARQAAMRARELGATLPPPLARLLEQGG